MKKFIILASVFLLAFSTNPQTAVNSGYDYFPMKIDGTGIVYREADSTSWWQSSGESWIMSRVNTGNNIRVTYTEYKSEACAGIHHHWRYTHLPSIPSNYASGLVYTQSLAGGKPGMAECRNESGVFMFPAETILTYNPIAGETFTVTTSNYNNLFQVLGTGTWTYKTLGYYATWGPFVDVIRTSLSESTGLRYNFVFAKEQWVTETIGGVVTTCWFPGGLVDFWTANPNLGTPTARPGRAYWARPCEI